MFACYFWSRSGAKARLLDQRIVSETNCQVARSLTYKSNQKFNDYNETSGKVSGTGVPDLND
jgi:hypothetical protein